MIRQANEQNKLTIGVLYGFRALMVLFVCNYHFWQQSWLAQQVTIAGTPFSFDFFTRSSYLFVEVMILLSGFLLYLPHAQAADEGTLPPTTRVFYQKRFMRIVPSYLVSVLLIFLLVMLNGGYTSTGTAALDLATHLTFTFTFFQSTYLFTPLNGVLWTLAIEVQFYLLFPLIVRWMRHRPATTLLLMSGTGLLFRAAFGLTQTNLTMLVNQLPSFMDVYALGMLGAILYVRLCRLAKHRSFKLWAAGLSVPLFLLCLFMLTRILRLQSFYSTRDLLSLHLSQWMMRLPLALTMLTAMLSAAFLPHILQKLLDNRLMRFLSVISLNLYIWHQVLAANVIRPLFPASLQQEPTLQIPYTLTCYSLAILTAMVFTYGVEKPAAKWLQKRFYKKGESLHERPPITTT